MKTANQWLWGGVLTLVVGLAVFTSVIPLQAAIVSPGMRWAVLSETDRLVYLQAGEPVDLVLNVQALGQAAPNQNMAFRVSLQNNAEVIANHVVLTATLPAGLTYRSDTANVSVVQQGNKVIWTWSSVAPHAFYEFLLFAQVGNLPLDTELTTVADVSSDNPETVPDDNHATDTVYVEQNTTWLYVEVDSPARELAPEAITRQRVQVCNMGFTCSGEIALTYTLPVNMTLLDWKPQTPGWELLSQTAHGLNLTYPSLGGYGEIPVCAELDVWAQVALEARDRDNLVTQVEIAADSDTDPAGNVFAFGQSVTGEWSDLHIEKKWLGGILTVGGELHYGIRVQNEGTTGATQVRITDTLPVGTDFVRATLPHSGAIFTPTLTQGLNVVWMLPYLAVGDEFEFDVHLAIQSTLSPGSVLVNQATVGALPDEWLVDNNTASWTEILHGHGVNLRIHNELERVTPYGFKYIIFYENVGDVAAQQIVITDTYPLGMLFAYGYTDPYLTIEDHPDAHELVLFAPSLVLGPGQRGYVELYFNATQPFGTWYNNVVTISNNEPEIDPSDNTAQWLSYGGTELAWVDIMLNHPYGLVRGQVRDPQGVNSVYLDTGQGTYFTPFEADGKWEIWTWQTFQPGDTVTFTAGSGYVPLVITVPDPFTAEADAGTGLVRGVLADAPYTPLTVWLESGEHRRTALNNALFYEVGFGPFSPGWGGHIEYVRDYDGTPVHLLRYFWDDTIGLHVNLGANDVAFDYAPQRQAHVLVKDARNVVLGEADLVSQMGSGVSGLSGFRTDPYSWYGGIEPDLLPYQTLEVNIDDGNMAQVQLGKLNLGLDVESDSVTGTVHAPWLGVQPVEVFCHLFAQSGDLVKTDSVIPNGTDGFTCSWAGEYDMTPFDGVFVEYRDPLGHYIGDFIHAPRPAVRVIKYGEGAPAADGNYIYHIEYENYGDAPAEDVVLTDIMGGQLYLGSTAPVMPTGSYQGPIEWHLGTLPAGAKGHFLMFTRVLAPVGELTSNTISITTSNPYNASAPWEMSYFVQDYVAPSDAHLRVSKKAYPWNPAPGQTLGYELQVCNDGNTTSAEVTLTDTLPPEVTLVGWWGDRPGWKQVSFNNNVLTLTYPAITGHHCESVGVRVRLNASVAVGTPFTNTVILTSNTPVDDGEDHVMLEASWPQLDVGVELYRVAGDLTPDGWLHYEVKYGNYGNVDMSSPAVITVTLPANTQFVEAWRRAPGDWSTPIPVSPTAQVGRDVSFTLLRLDTSLSSSFEFRVAIPPDAAVGTVLEAQAVIQALPGEGELLNNVSKWMEEVYPDGVNARIAKHHVWSEGRDRLTYEITFENVGDVSIMDTLIITDTLPAGVIAPQSGDVYFSYLDELGIEVDNGRVVAYVPRMPVGARGYLWFDVNLSAAQPYRWYTNTVELSALPEDQRLDDNVATDVAFSGTPFKDVNVHWGWLHQVVEGYALAPEVVLMTPDHTLTQATDDGYFYFSFNEELHPGDVLTLDIPDGTVPVEIPIPSPYTIHASSLTGAVNGQVGTQKTAVWVEIFDHGYKHIWTQPNGMFAVNFGPLPRGAQGFVKLESVNNETLVHVYRPFMTNDVLLKVNYAHDWVQALYARPGDSVTVTVNTTTGAYTVSGPVIVNEDWDQPHFYSSDHTWLPAQPDIQPGHTVQAVTTDGASTQFIVGTINATVDVAQDRLMGTVFIPSTHQRLALDPVHVECLPWGAPYGVEPIVTSVVPNGTAIFVCDWHGQWDIEPGQAIAVLYEQDGNAVMNVFNEAQQPGAPDVGVTQTAGPLPAVVGQTLTFTLTVENIGDALASGVRLTNTLPVSMTFVSVAGDVPCTPAGRLITCEVGDLASSVQKQVIIIVRPQAPGTFLNQVRANVAGDANPANNVNSLTFMVVAANQVRVFAVTPPSAVNTQATVITVQGANFSMPATVQLVGEAGTVDLSNVTVVSAQELQATVPAGLTPGTYHLRVSTPAAGSDTLLNAFTVLSSAPPSLAVMVPNQGVNTAPVLADIYGSNLAPGVTAALRRSGQADVALLNIGYVDNTHILATVPAGVAVGSYTLVITNPNGLSAQLPNAYTVLAALDDLLPRRDSFLVEPPSPRAGEAVSLTMTVRRAGGTAALSNVAVDFYVQDATGAETYLGRRTVAILPPDSRAATPVVFWTPAQSGVYTLRAVIDPTNAVAETFEDNNVITRTVEVLPARSRDVIPPTVAGLVINNGEERTTSRQVYLNATAVDNAGGSGVTHLLYVEYIFNQNTGHWMAVAVSGWVSYAEASTGYPWQLYPLAGAHYIQVWAADAAGNISADAGLRFINWVPGETPFSLAEDEVHSYLTRLSSGEGLTLRLTSVTGDADLYVWRATAAGPVLVAASYLEDPVEEVSFVAPAEGVYLIEVYGYAASTYRLDFLANGTARITAGGVILPTKGRGLPTSNPGITPASTTDEAGVPSAPVTQHEYYLFLPITLRGSGR